MMAKLRSHPPDCQGRDGRPGALPADATTAPPRRWWAVLDDLTSPARRDRLRWAVRVRWLAIGGFSVLAVAAWSTGVLPSLRASAVAAVLSAIVNAANQWCVARGRFLRSVTALAVPADVVLITYLIVCTGGAHSPF